MLNSPPNALASAQSLTLPQGGDIPMPVGPKRPCITILVHGVNDLAGVLDCAANTDISFCSSALLQDGHAGDWPSRVRYSKR